MEVEGRPSLSRFQPDAEPAPSVQDDGSAAELDTVPLATSTFSTNTGSAMPDADASYVASPTRTTAIARSKASG